MFLGDLRCRYLTLTRLNRTRIPTTTHLHALERRHLAQRLRPGAATAFQASPCPSVNAPQRPPAGPAATPAAAARNAYRASALTPGSSRLSACSRRSSLGAASVVAAGRASQSQSLVCWAQARRRSFSSDSGSDRDPGLHDAYDYPLPQQQLEAWYWSAVAASSCGSDQSGSASAAASEDSSEYVVQRVVQLPPAVNGWPADQQGGATMVQEVDPFTQDLKQVVAEAAAAAAATANGNGNGNGGASTSAAAAAAGSSAAAADDKAAPSVDVTRHNFDAMLPAVRRYLSACDFFAFDCEMTGLFLDGHNENYLDDMQDRYNRTAASAHAYVINQFGLSCFKRLRPDGPAGERRYAAATFNFYLFPRPPEGGAAAANSSARRFTCDAGSLAFLASQGFDFNRCIYDGVPFMPVRQRDELLRQVDGDRGGAEGGGGRADVVLSKPEDIAFVEGLLTTVREWLAAGAAAPLDLPPVSRYLRLLAYQALARPESFGGPAGGAPDWHPGFYVKKVSEPGAWTTIRLIPCRSAAEAAALEAAEREEKRQQIAAAAGFAAVWEALRECGRPGVGHNCMFDVAYGVAQFGEGRLPATWEGFKGVVSSQFRGGLYDTKHICRQLPGLLGPDTSLGVMFRSLAPQPPGQAITPLPAAPPAPDAPPPPALPANVSIAHAPGFEKYVAVAAGKLAHEAGYDAYMTGAVFAALEAVVGQAGLPEAPQEQEGVPPLPYQTVAPYVWRLNVTRSDLPYALLRPYDPRDPAASSEPVPERPLVFYLGQLCYGVRANDIHRACEEAGVGKVRITFLPGNNALIEVASPEAAAAVAGGALEQQDNRRIANEVLRYADYRARKDSMLSAGTWPLPGYGSGSFRLTGSGLSGPLPSGLQQQLPSFRAGGGAAGGAGGAGEGGAGGNGQGRGAKRPREEPVVAAAPGAGYAAAAAAAAGIAAAAGAGQQQVGGGEGAAGEEAWWRPKWPRWLRWPR